MPAVTVTSIEFSNFKALRQFSVSLKHMNVLVGPNNSGKSTVLGALRVLAAGLQKARSRNPELIRLPDGARRGYRIPEESIPISIENVHTDYGDAPTTVAFRLSTGNRLMLDFRGDRECYLFCEGRQFQTTSGFRSEFPVTIGVVPVLGPLEHEEPLVEWATVRRNPLPTGRRGTSEITGVTTHGNSMTSKNELPPLGQASRFCHPNSRRQHRRR
jgi:energy-coupling factor transporter ATP-binding protein EcfA2